MNIYINNYRVSVDIELLQIGNNLYKSELTPVTYEFPPAVAVLVTPFARV